MHPLLFRSSPYPFPALTHADADPACAAAINGAAARVQRGIRQPADSSERQATASGSLSGQRREEDRSHTLAHETLTAHSQGFNFCDGAPLTGGERLELCYFPADGDDRSFAGGDGATPPPSRQFNSGGINFDNSGFNPGSDPITADEPAQAAPWRPGGCTYIAQDPCARPTRAPPQLSDKTLEEPLA